MSLHDKTSRKLTLILLLFLNLSVLFYFKYANFFIENLNSGLNQFTNKQIDWIAVVLPIGISFYTFQTLSYIVDVYRRETQAQKELHLYLMYVFLFPQLIAGPIVKYNFIVEQLKTRLEGASNFIQGFIRFSIGLAKKVFLANILGEFAETLLYPEISEQISSSSAWIGMLCYTFQIYFDFSAYSDMAIGLGKMFGFDFPENFNRPYTSYSISQFWRKWHITLGDFMKNYLYIPLGGNKVSKLNIYRNLLLVFLLSGLWHGDNWTFVVWGLFHGFWIVLDRLFLENILSKIKFISIPFTFLLVLLSWVFFQADTIEQALEQIKTLFRFNFNPLPDLNYPNFYFFYLLLAVLICLLGFFSFSRNFSDKFLEIKAINLNLLLKIAVSILLFFVSLAEILGSDFNPFIYFKF
jgi:alginate O-acetyltransferase complex protein AlgI